MTRRSAPGAERRRLLDEAVEHASHLLPAQGPIGDFIHHNTLHAFQHLPFHDALAAASAVQDSEGYLYEARYREAWREGRITDADVQRALARRERREPDETLGTLTRRDIEWLALEHGIEAESPQGLRWAEAELALTQRFREDVPAAKRLRIVASTSKWLAALDESTARRLDAMLAPRTTVEALRAGGDHEVAALESLWGVCRALAPRSSSSSRARLLARVGVDRTHRDLLVAMGAPDPAVPSNLELVRFLAAYLDEGMARWAMPRRSEGLLACYRAQLDVAPGLLPPWLAAVQRRLRASCESQQSPAVLVISMLDELGLAPESWHEQVPRMLFELPGWSGMIARLERTPSDRAAGAPPASLLELLALRLALDLEQIEESARAIGTTRSGLLERARRTFADDERRHAHDAPYRLFRLCQLAGIAAPTLLEQGAGMASRWIGVLDRFDEIARRRTLHEAYELHHEQEVLGALAENLATPSDPEVGAPRFQVAFCIDDREESIRRHFEELGPDHRTFSVAGFFGVAMQYRGIDDAKPTALCPVVVRPTHRIEEVPVESDEPVSARRRRLRAILGWLRHELGDGSRSLTRGAALTPMVGLLAAIPLSARVLFPRLAHRAIDALTRWMVPTPATKLALHRPDDDEAPPGEGVHGFTLTERIDRVAGTLTNLGLTRDFGALVVLLGHGASTVNNPHHSAYDCGACGGRNGGPNARAFAAMANDPEVRAGLAARGIEIPESTWIIGGLHDTTTDAITLFDLDRVPAALASELEALRRDLDRARTMSAHERCRRFDHAPPNISPEAALAHVEERAVDLSQARPELGHVTNAACVVGRRALTRGLFLDRRAFLVSYDPSQDDARGTVLERILAAAVPVGAGINLEYYFSTVDEQRYGAGTKLPHNLAALLGVMEGASGDLRTGLPRQMIEIHEPVRLLCVIESTKEIVLGIAARQPEVAELVQNGWVRLALVDPETRAISVLGEDGFEPFTSDAGTPLPVVSTAADWYRGRRGFVPPARIARDRRAA